MSRRNRSWSWLPSHSVRSPEVGHRGPADALFKQGFVAVKKIRAALENGHLQGINGVGSQDVVVVRQGQIFAGGKLGCRVGVGADALVFHLDVLHPLGRRGYLFRKGRPLLHDLAHIGVGFVGGVRQAQLPPGAGLVKNAGQKLPQERLRRVVERHADADERQGFAILPPVGQVRPLGLQHLFLWQVAGPLAEEAAAEKAQRPPHHGEEAVAFHKIKGIAEQLPDAFEFQFHGKTPPKGPYFRP